MTQAERDRLVSLKKAKKKLITQKQATEDLGIRSRCENVPRTKRKPGKTSPAASRFLYSRLPAETPPK
jgi:hypothetical protein